MKRKTAGILLAVLLASNTPVMLGNRVKDAIATLLDELENAKKFGTNVATKIFFAGTGVVSFWGLVKGIGKIVENHGEVISSTPEEKIKKEAEQIKQLRIGTTYAILGTLGTIASFIAVRRLQ